jgi:hypothetical protein
LTARNSPKKKLGALAPEVLREIDAALKAAMDLD